MALSKEIDALCAAARWCYARGWAPATSGNFSARIADGPYERIFITPTGLDKSIVTPSDLLEIDREGQPLASNGSPSAEIGLHLAIYHARPQARAILHVHTVWNTLLSAHYAPASNVPIEGYEILKGLSSVSTHTHIERIPLLQNTQDYSALCSQMADALSNYAEAHGVLLSRHGLYTWGQSVAEARRHLEALEFLFEVEGRRLTAGPGFASRPRE